MRCLGIDPGSIYLGYGLIEKSEGRIFHQDGGRLSLAPKLPFQTRLQAIVEWLEVYLRENQPHCLVMEEAFVGRYASAAIKLGHVRGAVMALAFQKRIAVFEYTPRHIKQNLTGHGGAQKQQVGFMVQKILGLGPAPLSTDQTDALAIALTHLFIERKLHSQLAPLLA